MPRTWEIRKTEEQGGGWLVARTEPEAETPSLYAFRTLDSARNYVASVVQVEKRIRFSKHSDAHYSYRG